MKRLLAVPFILLFAACHPKPKPPEPPQPPAEDVCPNLPGEQTSVPGGYEVVNGECLSLTRPQFLDMLLRRDGSKFVVNGKPVPLAGCTPCCEKIEGVISGWPLFSEALVDHCQTAGKSNFFHARPGPFLTSDEPQWEPGGSYIEVNGKADLTQFSPRFSEAVGARIRYAGRHGAWTEVGSVDTWRLKGNCESSPWNKSRNIQGEDHCGLRIGDPVVEAWIRHVVEITGVYGNVIYEIGNESSGVEGKTQHLKLWEKWVYDTIRKYEPGVTHMVGTNSDFDEIEASFPDYVIKHGLIFSPSYGKPTEVNEVNPSPPDYPAMWCRMNAGGTYLWVWRDGIAATADWDKALAGVRNAIDNGCKPPSADQCPDPKPNPAKLRLNAGPSWGGFYDVTPLQTRDCAYCAATGQSDSGTPGVPRCECPARMECPGFQCEFRWLCEGVLMQSALPVWVGDGHIVLDSNGWRARCDDCKTLSVCNGPKTVCVKLF